MFGITVRGISPTWEMNQQILEILRTVVGAGIGDAVTYYPDRNEEHKLGDPIEIEIVINQAMISKKQFDSLAKELVEKIFDLHPLSKVSCVVKKKKKEKEIELAKYDTTMFADAQQS